jgi:hypothetical protein
VLRDAYLLKSLKKDLGGGAVGGKTQPRPYIDVPSPYTAAPLKKSVLHD